MSLINSRGLSLVFIGVAASVRALYAFVAEGIYFYHDKVEIVSGSCLQNRYKRRKFASGVHAVPSVDMS